MKDDFDSRVKEWWAMKKGNLKVKLEDDAGVDDQDLAKSNNQMFFHPGSYILDHSKRLMNNVVIKINGFYSNNIYYADRQFLYS